MSWSLLVSQGTPLRSRTEVEMERASKREASRTGAVQMFDGAVSRAIARRRRSPIADQQGRQHFRWQNLLMGPLAPSDETQRRQSRRPQMRKRRSEHRLHRRFADAADS